MFPMRAVKHWNRWCEGAGIGDVARLVEEAGFDGFSMSEHPYPDREWLARGGHHAFDPFVSLSFAAAAPTRPPLFRALRAPRPRAAPPPPNPFVDLFRGGGLPHPLPDRECRRE